MNILMAWLPNTVVAKVVEFILNIFQSQDWIGLVAYLAAVWGLLALSIWILVRRGSGFGDDKSGPRDAPWKPPGALIGAVWSCLYTLMALSLWLLNFDVSADQLVNKLTVITLFIFCLAWPFYAFDTSSRWPGLLGNLGIWLISVFAVWQLWPHAQMAALLIVPITVWITIASASILDGARRYGW